MDALELINEHIDVERLLEHYDFDKISPDGAYIRSACKIHGGNNPSSFVISRDTGLWYCHTSNCGGGDIYTLVQVMEGIDFPASARWVANFFGVDIDNMEIKHRKEKHIKEMKEWVKVMNSRKKKVTPAYSLDVPVREVRKFRTFKEETMEHFRLGFVESIELEKSSGGTYTLKNRLVFPIIKDGEQVGVSLRKTKANDFPKWSHQPKSIETSNILYNYDAAIGQERVVITEGALDVWAYHEIGVVAVATFGAHVTDEQYKLLMRTGADLVFSFDGDEAGREATAKAITGYKDKTGKFIEGMFKNKANCFIVPFEDGEDPESIPREQLKLKYESRERK
jgi:DNA primase